MAVMSYPDDQAINLFLGKPQQAQVTGVQHVKVIRNEYRSGETEQASILSDGFIKTDNLTDDDELIQNPETVHSKAEVLLYNGGQIIGNQEFPTHLF